MKVWLGQRAIGLEADVWSFGLVLYALIELKVPYENMNMPVMQVFL